MKKLKGDCREGATKAQVRAFESIDGSVTTSIFSRALGWHVCLPTTLLEDAVRRRWRVGMTSQTKRRRNTKMFVLLAGERLGRGIHVVHRFLFTVWIVFFERPLCRDRAPSAVKFNRRFCISISASGVLYAYAFNSSYCMETVASLSSFLSFLSSLPRRNVRLYVHRWCVFFFLMQWVVQEWKIARDSLRYGS